MLHGDEGHFSTLGLLPAVNFERGWIQRWIFRLEKVTTQKVRGDYLLNKNSLCWLSHWRNGPLSDEVRSTVIELERLAVFFLLFISTDVFKGRSGLVHYPQRMNSQSADVWYLITKMIQLCWLCLSVTRLGKSPKRRLRVCERIIRDIIHSTGFSWIVQDSLKEAAESAPLLLDGSVQGWLMWDRYPDPELPAWPPVSVWKIQTANRWRAAGLCPDISQASDFWSLNSWLKIQSNDALKHRVIILIIEGVFCFR